MEKIDKNKELKEKFLNYYAALPIKKLAAQKINRTLDTINDWEKADANFSAQVNEKYADWAHMNATKVHSREWLLERVMNDHFGQRTKQDITSGGEKIIPILGGLNGVSVDNGNQETSPTKEEN